MTDKSAMPVNQQAPSYPTRIPETVRDMLGKRKRWHDMLEILEKLEAGDSNVSEGHIQIEWDVFKSTLTTDCASAAAMLISTLACICMYRPDMFEKLIVDAFEPLAALDVKYANEVMDWYMACDSLDPAIMQWIKITLPDKMHGLQASGNPSDTDKAVLDLLGLSHDESIAELAPDELLITNYNVVLARCLFALLVASPGIFVLWFSLHLSGVLIVGGPFILAAIWILWMIRDIETSVEFSDTVEIHHLFKKSCTYSLSDIRHLSMHDVRAKLYGVLTLATNSFVDIEFRDGHACSPRISQWEVEQLMLFLAARGFAPCFDTESRRNKTLPIIITWLSLGD